MQHFDVLMDQARGRWRSILMSVGIPRQLLNGKEQPCPFCGGKDRFRWTNKDNDGWYLCRKCQSGDGWEFAARYLKVSKKQAAEQIRYHLGHAKKDRFRPHMGWNRKKLLEMWREAWPILDGENPALKYLRNRGIELLKDPQMIRYHPHLGYSHDGVKGVFPAMLVLFNNDDKDLIIQRTYLTDEGEKADVPVVKKNTPGQVPEGGAVRLYGYGQKDTIGVAEGVETALSAAKLDQIPVWATLSDRGMMKWKPPEGIRNIIIYGDNDASFAGQRAAFALAHRLKNHHGLHVDVRIPDSEGDWNDVLIVSK